jgi:hypothetical protein
MKNCTALLAAIMVAFSACHKHASTTCSNSISIVDDSRTYTECASPPSGNLYSGSSHILINCVYVSLEKPHGSGYAYDSVYTVSAVGAMNSPFTLSMQNATAGMSSVDTNGIGVYTLHPKDSSVNTFHEGFSGKTFESSGGTINITHADSTNISGTFTVIVFNSVETKTISGTFGANQPIIVYY